MKFLQSALCGFLLTITAAAQTATPPVRDHPRIRDRPLSSATKPSRPRVPRRSPRLRNPPLPRSALWAAMKSWGPNIRSPSIK